MKDKNYFHKNTALLDRLMAELRDNMDSIDYIILSLKQKEQDGTATHYDLLNLACLLVLTGSILLESEKLEDIE